MPDNHSYVEGLRDGKISALEKNETVHKERLDNHEKRLVVAERILYGLIGAITLIQLVIPIFGKFIGAGI